MNKELDKFKEEMIDACPLFFERIRSRWCIECPNNYHGYDIGPGWFGLIREVCELIEMKNRVCISEGKPTFKAVFLRRVRKSLRFSVSAYNPDPVLNKLIELIEEKSKTMCEICGERAQYRNGIKSKLKILCDFHLNETIREEG